MNNEFSKNFLLTSLDSNDPVAELFKLCFKQAKNSKTVLYLSFKQIGKLPDIGVGYEDKEVLKKIVFMYFQDVDLMINKLLELHSWSIIPHLILLDCSQISNILDNNQWPKQKICLMISCLFNLTQSLCRRLNDDCISLLYIDGNQVPSEFLQLLVDLYYYKTSYSSLEDLSQKLG